MMIFQNDQFLVRDQSNDRRHQIFHRGSYLVFYRDLRRRDPFLPLEQSELIQNERFYR